MAYSFTQEQVGNAQTIVSVGAQVGASAHQIRAALAASYVESRWKNLNYGDRDSLGLFQQRPSQGWGTPVQIMNPVYAAGKFYEEARRVSNAGTPGQLAQRVQRSAFPARYDEQIGATDEMLARLGGAGAGLMAGANDESAIMVLLALLAIGLLVR